MNEFTEITSSDTILFIPNWENRVAGEVEPNNREIIAYMAGKEDGKNEEVESNKQLFLANLELCCYYSGKLYEYLTTKKNVACELATIKADSISEFQALFVIKFDNYKDEGFRTDVFKEANEYRKALRSKDVCLELRLVPVVEEIDKADIFQDGYFLRYNKKG